MSISEFSEAALLAGAASNQSALVPAAAVMVAARGPAGEQAESSEEMFLTGRAGQPVPSMSQSAVLVAFSTGVRERFDSRAWYFEQDGHAFYVLSLGTTGTFVYDKQTQQWSEWQTQGFPFWHAEHGAEWDGKVLAGAQTDPSLFRVDPTAGLDEGFRTIQRVVTGLATARGRSNVSVGALYVTAASGTTQKPDPEDTTLISLRFSDDRGKTWVSAEDIVLVPQDYEQEVAWRALGSFSAPGRLFEITDIGGPVNISAATIETED